MSFTSEATRNRNYCVRSEPRVSTELEFKPRMLGIICNWCCYGGADLCGVSRFQYPPFIRLLRVMCSAWVDMAHIFRALSKGLDAVFIGGCHLNDCHYVTNGNYDALSMVQICKRLLAHTGVNPDRVRLEWVSAGEGIRFANIMNEYGEAWVVGYGIDADRIIALTHQSPDETRRAIGLRIHMVERVHEACIVGMVFRLHKPGDVDLCDVKTSHS